jgi:hypothetical protein
VLVFVYESEKNAEVKIEIVEESVSVVVSCDNLAVLLVFSVV